MDAREAISQAKNYVSEIFRDESISNPGLEEVEFDDGSQTWIVTVGFSRPWNTVRNALTVIAGEPAAQRSYKVVRIRDSDHTILSIRDRNLELEH